MITNLNLGALGLRAEFDEAVELAATHGFGAVEAGHDRLTGLGDPELAAERELLAGKGLRYGPVGLPVDLRAQAAAFADQLGALPALAARLEAAGITRVGTWICPQDDDLSYRRNFRRHAERVALVAEVLEPHGVSLGLEYVGPKTSWTAGRFPFIHSLTETLELIEETGRPNVGVVLDSYHWYTAGETAEDLRQLSGSDVVYVDVNDAPAGRERDEQMDLERELPGTTGVIDLAGFVGALAAIGYDGPVKVEPFNAELRALPVAEAVRKTADAIQASLKV